MRTGKTLPELMNEIQRQAAAKRDYVADTRAITMTNDGGLELADKGRFRVNNIAHRQLAEKVGIPAKYYDRLKETAPNLLAENVNYWLHTEHDRRMVRTLDGVARGVLSDKYRNHGLEHIDVAEAIIPALIKRNLWIASAEITEYRLYIKAVDMRIHRDVPKGRKMGDGTHTIFDTLCPALFVGNSEVGHGSYYIESGVYTKGCTNLAMFAGKGMRKHHVGRRADVGDDVYHLLTDQTRRVTDEALRLQMRDVVAAALDHAKFDATVDKITATAEDRIQGDPVKVVEVVQQHFGMNDHERAEVLKNLIEGADLSRYGLFNAITRTAEDLGDYDRASEFEKFGGQVIDLPKKDWQQIAVAESLPAAA